VLERAFERSQLDDGSDDGRELRDQTGETPHPLSPI